MIVPPEVLVPSIITGGVLVLGGIITGVFAVLNRRGGEKNKRQPTWGELVNENRSQRAELNEERRLGRERDNRLDALENHIGKRDRAFANVLRDAAAQWPKEHAGPVFNPDDVEVLEEDTFPVQWRRPRSIIAQP